MFPKLFEYHWLVVHSYGLLLALAFIIGLYISAKAASQEHLDKAKIYDLGLYIAISSLLGAKLMLFVTDFEYYSQNPGEVFSLATLRSGGVYYGGFILAVIVGISFTRYQRLPVWKVADIFSPGIALGQSIGRLGCFAAGCCYGKPTKLPLGVIFQDPYSHETVGVPLMIPLHPTQLYEAAWNAIIFVILWLSLKSKKFDGQVFIFYLVLYSPVRFLIEFLRGDADRGFLFNGLLSTSQFISLALLVVAGMLFLILKPAVQEKSA